MRMKDEIEAGDIVERTVADGSVQRALVVKAFGVGGGFSYRTMRGRKAQKTLFEEYDETTWKKVSTTNCT